MGLFACQMERGATRHKNTPSLSLGFQTFFAPKSFQQGTVTLDRRQSLMPTIWQGSDSPHHWDWISSLQQHGPKNWCSTLKPGENWSWPTYLTLTDNLMNHLNIRSEEISMGSLVTWPHTYYYWQAAAFPPCYSSMLLLQPDLQSSCCPELHPLGAVHQTSSVPSLGLTCRGDWSHLRVMQHGLFQFILFKRQQRPQNTTACYWHTKCYTFTANPLVLFNLSLNGTVIP